MNFGVGVGQACPGINPTWTLRDNSPDLCPSDWELWDVVKGA